MASLWQSSSASSSLSSINKLASCLISHLPILLQFCILLHFFISTMTEQTHKKRFTQMPSLNINMAFVYCHIVNCTAGTYLNQKLGTCEDCAIGFYQEKDAQVECLKCPAGTSTTDVRTDSSSSCLGRVFNFCMHWEWLISVLFLLQLCDC